MKSKKIVVGIMLSVILVLQLSVIGFNNVVYAALKCGADLVLSKTKVSENEEFTVDFVLTGVEADRGIISLGATLQYDKNKLELVKIEGKNGWETPNEGSFNEENGKMALTRSSRGTKSETVLTMTFKLKDTSQSKIPISLKDIVIADGYNPVDISVISKEIEVNKTKEPDKKPDDDTSNTNKPNNNSSNNSNSSSNSNSTNQGNYNNGNNSSNNSSNVTNKDITQVYSKLPKTGENRVVIMIAIGIAIIFAMIFGFKIRMINKDE